MSDLISRKAVLQALEELALVHSSDVCSDAITTLGGVAPVGPSRGRLLDIIGEFIDALLAEDGPRPVGYDDTPVRFTCKSCGVRCWGTDTGELVMDQIRKLRAHHLGIAHDGIVQVVVEMTAKQVDDMNTLEAMSGADATQSNEWRVMKLTGSEYGV